MCIRDRPSTSVDVPTLFEIIFTPIKASPVEMSVTFPEIVKLLVCDNRHNEKQEQKIIEKIFLIKNCYKLIQI